MVGIFIVGLALIGLVILLLVAYRKPGPDQKQPGDRAGEAW